LVHMHSVLLDVCSTNIHTFSFPVPRMCVLYHYFYCILPCYLPPNYSGLKCLNSCVKERRLRGPRSEVRGWHLV
jgi:hypothetical protein